MHRQLLVFTFITAPLFLMGMIARLEAQTFTVLHNFNGSDGSSPVGLLVSGGTLYGVANAGGPSGNGTVFKLNGDGTGFTNLHNFGGWPDGFNPSGLTLVSNTLYGTTFQGGNRYVGTVFKMNIDGTDYSILYSFSYSDGGNPVGGVCLAGSTLYGACYDYPSEGSIFAINTDGTGYSILAELTRGSGGYPLSGLQLSDGTLYGSTTSGDGLGNGNVFAMNTDGSGFTILHSFQYSDGFKPYGAVTLSGNTLYGTTHYGGLPDSPLVFPGGWGTVFAVNTDATSFRTLHMFTAPDANTGTNLDGVAPQGALVLSRDTLYGTTSRGGTGNGTVFGVNTDGTRFRTVHTFTSLTTNTNNDGANPYAVVLVNNDLYGVTAGGGCFGNGTVFRISFRPQLQMMVSGTVLVLSWAMDYPDYTLQSTTNLSASSWTTNLPSPVLVNGQYTVTNPISGTQQYFRLSQ